MILERLWVVRDPDQLSELDDIVWEFSSDRIARTVVAVGLNAWERERHTLYTDEAEAMEDARERMAKERARRDRVEEAQLTRQLEASLRLVGQR